MRTEQRLVRVSGSDGLREPGDSGRLVAGGGIRGVDLERHRRALA